MSISELERAATAPRRWIALSSSKDRNEDGVLPRRTVRLLEDFVYYGACLVPGGRYVVACGIRDLAVWDLGYVSDRMFQPTKIWATTIKPIDKFLFQPTPDGIGIRIFAYSDYRCTVYIFEIRPGKEIIEDAKVAQLTFDFLGKDLDHLLYGNRVVTYARRKGILVVWDFVANTMASWSIYTPTDSRSTTIFRAIETAIMIRDMGHPYPSHSMRIFQIPPLVTTTRLFDTEEKLPELAPVLTFKYSDASATTGFPRPNCWYNNLNSLPLYFDVIESSQQSNVGRYKLDITSDFSSFSLTPTSAIRVPMPIEIYLCSYSHQKAYRICENSSVTAVLEHDGSSPVIHLSVITLGLDPYSNSHDPNQTPSTHINTTPLARQLRRYPYSFCPASARFIYATITGDFIVCDLL